MMGEKGFFDVGDGIEKGKSITAIGNSRDEHSTLRRMFGTADLPSSVMRAERAKPTLEIDEHATKRGYKNTRYDDVKGNIDKLPKVLQKAVGASGTGCHFGALSTFPQNIGRTMVLFYSDPGQTVYDPFAGHNSRMDLCVTVGRHYTACDLSTEFMAFNKKRAAKLRKLYPSINIELHHCDSRKVPVADESADFTITSPPYWDIEYYGDEDAQLGMCETYKDFLGGMRQVLEENVRVLRPGSYAVYFINDFRKKGKMYFYHADLIRQGEKAGFIAHDIVISDLGRGIRDCFLAQTVQQRILPKRHEYGIVFRKPTGKEKSNPDKERGAQRLMFKKGLFKEKGE